jgi:hypothetical protein
MHVFGALELDIQPGTPETRPLSELPSCATPGARMDACSSHQSAYPSTKWRGSSMPCKTSWTRSVNEPREPFKWPEPRLQDRLSGAGFKSSQ